LSLHLFFNLVVYAHKTITRKAWLKSFILKK
jgi:hypothetical protein